MSVLAVIPAAGKGSRLKINKPKIMVKIGSHLIIDILIQKLLGLVDKIIFVVNPKYKKLVYNYLKKKYYNQISFDIISQNTPKGMSHAIFQTKAIWKKYDKILFMWGDQVGVTRETINKLIRVKLYKKSFALPLVKKNKLYVEYCIKKSKLKKILETREGDICSDNGYCDTGVFLFNNFNLTKFFLDFYKNQLLGKITKEKNFLQFMVYLSKKNWSLKYFVTKKKLESIGINTKSEINFFKKLYDKN